MGLLGAIGVSHGLEAWRLTVQRHVSRTRVEIHNLEHAAQNPSRCHRHGELDAAVAKWEESVKRYHGSLAYDSPERFAELCEAAYGSGDYGYIATAIKANHDGDDFHAFSSCIQSKFHCGQSFFQHSSFW